MQPIWIIKTGSTFPAIKAQFGDFDHWIMRANSNPDMEFCVFDVESDAALPRPEACSGVIITGSPAMVTDKLDWSVRLENWLPDLIKTETPILGICYGHQLLAESLGGQAGNHPKGKEIGTVNIQMHSEASNDPLLQTLPGEFLAHVTHTQSALRLPPDAVCLARSSHESHHAFRVGRYAWGVQFHPEFNANIMRAYIEQQPAALREQGIDPEQCLQSVKSTPVAEQVLTRFFELVASRTTT